MVLEQLHWLVVAAAVSGAVVLLVAGVAFRNRRVPGATALGLLSIVAGAWAFVQVWYLVAPTPSGSRAAYRVTSVLSFQIPILWLAFALVYAGHGDWLTRGRTLALWAPLTAYGVLRATAPVHGFLSAPLSIETVGGITAPVPEWTTAYAVGTVVAYAYLLVGFGVLSQFYVDPRNVYREQTAVIIAVGLVPTLGNVLSTMVLTIHPGISPAPALFVVSGVGTAAVLFRYTDPRVDPIAGNVLVDELPEPVLVVDDDGVIVDANPAAARLTTDSDPVRSPLSAVLGRGPDELKSVDTVAVDTDDETQLSVFDVQVTAIEDQFGAPHAQLVLLRDVTGQQRRLEQLEAMQAATEQFISARTVPEVADIAITFASDVLDHPYAVVFVYDEETDALESTAATQPVTARMDDDVILSRGSGPVWDAFESGETKTFEECPESERTWRAFPSTFAVFPLGEHGVLAVGTDRDVDYSPVDYQMGKILAGTVATALTRVAHEQQLRRSQTRLEQRTEQIEFFNGVLRHNIRNSMMVIDGHAQFLETRLDGDDADKLATIRRWCDDLTELTEKVRDITDTVTAAEAERLGRVDLSAVVSAQATRLTERYDDVTVEVDLHDDVDIVANGLVADVLESVLTNAVEHSDVDAPWVSVTTRDLGDWVQVRLADNGPGLSDEMKTRVFEREVATSQTSHGFGLYFVSVMMDLYEGTVWFEDRENDDVGPDPPGDDGATGTIVALEFRVAEEPRERTGRDAAEN